MRNNQQTGPFTLEQLLELKLKPFDLVWVDGRSAAWQYPGEVPALKPYVPATPQADLPYMPVATSVMDETGTQAAPPAPQQQQQTAARKIFVSMPRAAAVTTQPAYAQPEAQPVQPTPPPIQQPPVQQVPVTPAPETRYTRSLNDVEEDYTSWIYNQKTKKKRSIAPKDMAIAAVLILLIGGGYFLLSRPSLTAGQPPAQTQAAVTAAPAAAEETVTSPSLDPAPTLISQPSSSEAKTVIKDKTKKPEKTVTQPAPIAVNNTPEKTVARETPTTEQPVTQPQSAPVTTTTEPAQKKKKLRDVFKNIFNKPKNKAAEAPPVETTKTKTVPVLQEPRPANNRQATHRGDDGSETSSPAPTQETNTTSIADQVDISSNAPDSWMIGVTGLKVTLRNRSNAQLQSASVDVLYYDQNNKLLEKKTLYFNGVQPKGRQTQAAPDHKWADHVDLKLGTVTAKDDRYARG